MLLSKEIAVYMNLAACKMKQFMAARLKKYKVELTPEQFLLLDILWNEGPMSQQNLADIMQKDKNSITKLVDALERKDFIVRKRDVNDRRSNIVHITPKAEQLKTGAKEKGIFLLDQVLKGISEDELRGFLITLNKMSENMTSEADEK